MKRKKRNTRFRKTSMDDEDYQEESSDHSDDHYLLEEESPEASVRTPSSSSTSSSLSFQAPRRRPYAPISSGEKEAILRVYAYFLSQSPRGAKLKTATVMLVPRASLASILKEYIESQKTIEHPRGNFTNHPTLIRDKIGMMAIIRDYVDTKAAAGEIVSARAIHTHLINSNVFAKDLVSYHVFLRFLHRCGYTFGKRRAGKEHSLVQKSSMAVKKAVYADYLSTNMNAPEAERFVEIYTGESYIRQYHSQESTWSSPERPSTVRIQKANEGRRFCFAACISEHGLLPGSLWLFCPDEANQRKADYHSCFNANNYEQYFCGTLSTEEGFVGMMNQFEAAFPGRRAMFIMDNAKYHCFYRNIPSGGDKKQVLVDYLVSQGEEGVSMSLTKPILRGLLAKYRTAKNAHLVKLAEARKHIIVWTPPYHSDWQPIELYWAAAKNAVARRYRKGRSLDETKKLILDALDEYGDASQTKKLIDSCRARVMMFLNAQKALDAAEDEAPPVPVDADDDEDQFDSSCSSDSSMDDD